MMFRKCLVQQIRNCANWSAAQRHIQKKQGLVTPQIFEEYQRSFQKIVDKGLTNIRFNPELCDRLKKITEYNTGSGKQIRGLLAVSSCQALLNPEREEELREKIFALGWTVEMFHAFFLMTDDMEDGAKTRRGKTCWHLLPDVGAYAINDVGLFRTFISEIIKQYFGKDDVYANIVNIFNEAYMKTHIGQFIDTTLCKSRNYLNLTKETYVTTVKYKTAGYSFEFPVLLGLAVSKKESEKAFKLVESICNDVGLLLQMQNDFLDFYDDESVGGKSGTDIQEGKCSWLALTALKHCNNYQKQIFLSNYGRWEPENVNEIRKLYNELQLYKICRNEETLLYESLLNKINSLTEESIPPGHLFSKLVEMVYTVGNIKYEEKSTS